MYEPEVNSLVESVESLPADVRQKFGELRDRIQRRSILPWGEHCTECNWPSCYTSCELYTPRTDGGCRLFIDGMVRMDHPSSVNGYVLKIRFKHWGKLWTVGNVRMHSLADAGARERSQIRVGALARSLPVPGPIKARVLQKVSYLRRRTAEEEAAPTGVLPDTFLVECFNPGARAVNLTVTIRPRAPAVTDRPFQGSMELVPGYSRASLPFAAIAPHLDLALPFEIEMVPNEANDTLLYFGLMEFVQEKPMTARPMEPSSARPDEAKRSTKKWKCIVWDLDNTLWEGTLLEDGPERLRLRQQVVEVIRETDRRGILHSIASKNNPADALGVLRGLGLEDLFLHPQIGWEPKSRSIRRIAEQLNIGLDTLAFVDDQPFEREEVQAALDQVAVVDAADAAGLAARPECDVPVTEEGRQRRQLYRQQEQRQSFLAAHDGDYLVFLRECKIVLELDRLTTDNLERVYELAQRTNQMNFSGNRYPRADLQALLGSASRATYVMRCQDRFGSYGIVGFAVVDPLEPRLLDLMFSCRIQAKRIEHAVIGHLLRKHLPESPRGFHVNYRWTEKNAPSGKVFEDLGFVCADLSQVPRSLHFPKDRPVSDEAIVTLVERAGS